MSEHDSPPRSYLDVKLDDPKFFRAFCEEGADVATTEMICELMEKQDVSREELARRLGVRKGSLTRIFRGTSKLTINHLGAIAWALGCDIPLMIKGTRR